MHLNSGTMPFSISLSSDSFLFYFESKRSLSGAEGERMRPSIDPARYGVSGLNESDKPFPCISVIYQLRGKGRDVASKKVSANSSSA